MAGCGSCGGRSGVRGGSGSKWQWQSADGKQIVRGLTQQEAEARAGRLGGTARAQ